MRRPRGRERAVCSQFQQRVLPGKDPRAEPGLPYLLRKKPVGVEPLQEQRETLYRGLLAPAFV